MVARPVLFSTSAIIALVIGGAATGAVAADTNNSTTEVGQVVVTAQKRTQNLQDVPVVVTVLNAKQLQDAGVKDVKDLTVLTPGLSATTNASEATTTVRIRGIGTVADNSGLEDGVGIYIDNVYRPRNGVGFNDLGELSDVEVLKGPQGTLFGKNTVGGVIQIETQRPSFNFGYTGEATVQNYNGYGGSASVTGPILGDQLAGRFYVADRQRDGYIDVVQAAGTPKIPAQNDEHMFTTRDQLLYQPNNNFDVNFIGDYTKRDDHCCAAVEYLSGAPAGLLNTLFPGSTTTTPNPLSQTAYLEQTSIEHITEYGVSAEAHWTTPWLNGAKLTSITAYRDWKDNQGYGTNSTEADLLNSPANENSTEFKQFSEELRYNGEAGRLTWQVGAFFDHEDLNQQTALLFGSQLGTYLNVLSAGALPAAAFVPGEGTDDFWAQKEHGETVYTQDEFKITDQLSIIGGLRYSAEHKALATTYTNNDTVGLCQSIVGAPGPGYVNASKAALSLPCLIDPAFAALGHTNQSLDEGAVTGTVKAQYKFSSTAMTYASYSRGNLVGGFNLAEVTLPVAGTTAPNTSLAPDLKTAFPAEWVDAYEIGAKTQWLDRRLSLNGALFYQIYQDFQLNAFTGTQFIETTIPKAVTRGAELEAYYQASHDLLFNGGVTYADTFYPASAANDNALSSGDLFRLPGSNLSFAPLWSVTGGMSYQHPISDTLIGTFSLDGKYQSSYNTGSDHDANKLQEGFSIFNGRIGITSADHRWSLEAWGTNLFDVRYKLTAFDGVLQTFGAPQPSSQPSMNDYYYFPAAPRFFGLTFRIKS